MKKINILFILLVFTLFSACDFIEKPIIGSESLDTYFATEDECNQYTKGLYAKVGDHQWSPIYMWWIMTDMSSDDSWMGSTYQPAKFVEFQPVTHYEGSSSTTTNIYLGDFWESRYKGIFAANIGVDRISQADIDPGKKEQFVAEAKFLRAYFYFELVKNFGGVPLVLTNLTPAEVLKVSKSSVADIYMQIESDLTYAADILPYKAGMTYESGRTNKGMVQALMSKVLLYQEKYADALLMAKLVIKDGGYRLEDDFNDVWSDKDNSPEAIFEIQTNSEQAYEIGNPCPVVTGSRDDGGWAWGAPTSHLQNAFEAEEDDIRRRATIVVSGEAIVGEPDVVAYNMTGDWHKSNRIIRKYYIPKAKRTMPYTQQYNKLNHHILRYADLLLIAAEAAFHSSTPDEGAARGYLNQVRGRVHLDDIEASVTGNALRDAIRLERRLELAFEHHRLFDLRRWKADDGKPMISHIMGTEGSFVKYNMEDSVDPFETTNSIEPSNKGYYYKEGRDELFPLPYIDVQLSNGILVQNPGFNQ